MIKAFLRFIFSKLKIEAGQVFEFKLNTSNPFAPPPHKVEVIAVKDGWVKYRFCDAMPGQNSSIKIGTFRYCYKLEREEPK